MSFAILPKLEDASWSPATFGISESLWIVDTSRSEPVRDGLL